MGERVGISATGGRGDSQTRAGIVARARPTRGPARRAFDGFYREHFVVAWRALHRLGVTVADCDDATQEVFVAAHRRWRAFDEAVPRRAWLLGIVRRIAWRYRRTDERRARRLEAIALIEPVAPSLDDLVLRREADRLLGDFLEGLEPSKREAFVLGELEELGRRELGHALGINANTAYSRLQAARREFLAHFAVLDDEGCATLLACAERATELEQDAQARTWSRLVVLLWPRSAGLPLALCGLMALAAPIVIDGARASADPEVALEPRAPEEMPAAAPAVALPPVAPADMRPATPESHDGGGRAASPRRAPPRIRDAAVASDVATSSATAVPASDEVALLLSAREAMVAGDFAAARRSLDEHEVRFGAGTTLARLRAGIVRDLDAAIIRTPASGDRTPSRTPR